MVNERGPKIPNMLEELKDAIRKAPKGIEAEFLRSPNSWPACFAGHLDVIDVYISLSNKKGLITLEEYKSLNSRVEELKKEIYLLKEQYPEKNTILPENIKKDLLKKLDIFNGDIDNDKMKEKIIFNEQGLKPGTPYEKDQWKKIVSHNDKEIKGFFGEYRFLSNFEPAKVFLDGEEYSTTENAYQAAKYEKEFRDYLKKCSPKEAIVFAKDNKKGKYTKEEWDNVKLKIMKDLLIQKFDKDLNPENYKKLKKTGNKYLEETNYWNDVYWGVNKNDAKEEGIGENNLGKLLMEIRDNTEK